MQEKLNVVIVGCTGVVGGEVLKLLHEDSRIGHVYAFSRRPLHSNFFKNDEKIINEVMEDFHHLRRPENCQKIDLGIFCFGTTRKEAKSRKNFMNIERDLGMKLMDNFKEWGVEHFLLVSALGANEHSPFLYPRVKGELEVHAKKLNFPRLSILRPSLLLAQHRLKKRVLEDLSVKIYQEWVPASFKKLIPLKFRPITPREVALQLLNLAF